MMDRTARSALISDLLEEPADPDQDLRFDDVFSYPRFAHDIIPVPGTALDTLETTAPTERVLIRSALASLDPPRRFDVLRAALTSAILLFAFAAPITIAG